MAKVLVVDDDPDVLQLVSFRLRKAQHKVIAVSGGHEALEWSPSAEHRTSPCST